MTIVAVSTTSWVVSAWWRCATLSTSSRDLSTSRSGSTGVPARQPSASTVSGTGSLVASVIAVAASRGMSPTSAWATATAASKSTIAATRDSSLQISVMASVEKPG